MAKMVWDQLGERLFETGVEQVAIYPMGTDGQYGAGAPWNGITAVNESPSGAESTPLYANDKKYGELTSAEEFGGTIEAYMYPDEFGECNGEKEVVPGFTIGQQTRKPFCLVYKTLIGNDTEGIKHGYKLNVVYNAKVTPSEKTNNTVNDSPEAGTMSWEFTTTPVEIEGYDASAKLTFNSTTIDASKLEQLEAKLYGSESEEAAILMPDEIITLIGTAG